jgi:hypothetical protein
VSLGNCFFGAAAADGAAAAASLARMYSLYDVGGAFGGGCDGVAFRRRTSIETSSTLARNNLNDRS